MSNVGESDKVLANPGTFAAGWNACCLGMDLRDAATPEEKDGFGRAMRVPKTQRIMFNKTAAQRSV
jgi:hypothetical protein